MRARRVSNQQRLLDVQLDNVNFQTHWRKRSYRTDLFPAPQAFHRPGHLRDSRRHDI